MIYALLNHDAKKWWYFAQLRREGRAAEARTQERDTIRKHLGHIRDALANRLTLEIHPHCFILNLPHGWLRGYGDETDSFVKACHRAGIQVVRK